MTAPYFEIVKSIHIIFVVSYFAGIFYIVRLMIYHTEAQGKEAEKALVEQFTLMEKRLWNIIIVPAGIIMLLSGLGMLYLHGLLIKQPWMHLKLSLLLFLLAYHIWCWWNLRQLQRGVFRYSSVKLRMANEVATLILFAVVFTVILKSYIVIYWYWILISFVLLGLLIMMIVKLTNKNQ